MAMVGIRNQYGAYPASRLDDAGEVQTTIASACKKALNLGRMIQHSECLWVALLSTTGERSLPNDRTPTKTEISPHALP